MTTTVTNRKRKVFHATIRATRIEEWFIEAETEEQARTLLESGAGHRSQIGQCVHFEIEKLAK